MFENEFPEGIDRLLEERYLMKDEDGEVVEEPTEMFERVAENIANADRNWKQHSSKEVKEVFLQKIMGFDFVPSSPILMNAGTELQQLASCFVLPIEDSLDSIFETLKNTALIHSSGGGTGFSFSKIRPKGDIVKSTGGVASGPISFMKVFDSATEQIKQGGRRRGANMGVLRIDHPDIMNFIRAKDKASELTNFNISVGVTKEFIKSLKNNKEFELVNPRSGETTEKKDPNKIWSAIAESSWKNGEPGVLFLDKINENQPFKAKSKEDKYYIESTNPCAEAPLMNYESCILGSINLSNMVIDGSINWERMREAVRVGVHFLDNCIEVSEFPIEEIRKMTMKNRKIGLGVMGFHDMLIQLEVPYDSSEAVELASEVMEFVSNEAREKSHELAQERGCFPNYDESKYGDRGVELRNATLTTIAPTGSISLIANCSAGIEPIFAVSYLKNVLGGIPQVNQYFVEKIRESSLDLEEVMDLVDGRSSIQDVDAIPEEIRKIFKTAHDISPKQHVRIQAAFQEYTDNAVSKTINFPKDTGVDEVREAIEYSYELDCKGITIYRTQTRSDQVLQTSEPVKEECISSCDYSVVREE